MISQSKYKCNQVLSIAIISLFLNTSNLKANVDPTNPTIGINQKTKTTPPSVGGDGKGNGENPTIIITTDLIAQLSNTDSSENTVTAASSDKCTGVYRFISDFQFLSKAYAEPVQGNLIVEKVSGTNVNIFIKFTDQNSEIVRGTCIALKGNKALLTFSSRIPLFLQTYFTILK